MARASHRLGNEQRAVKAVTRGSFSFGAAEVLLRGRAARADNLSSHVTLRGDQIVSSADAERCRRVVGYLNNPNAERMINRIREDLAHYAQTAGKRRPPSSPS